MSTPKILKKNTGFALKKELDEKGMVATVLMDLLKAYDCILHELLIAKLNAYGIDSVGLSLISD